MWRYKRYMRGQCVMSSKICLDLMEKKKKKNHEFIKLFVLFNNHCVHEVQRVRGRGKMSLNSHT